MNASATPPTKDPQVAGCLGFVFSAISASFAAVAWMHWRIWAEILNGMPSDMRSGGTAFSMNVPGFALEFAAYAFALAGFMTLGGVWLWKPTMLRSWYSVGGVLCLVPGAALLAVRLGWLRL